METVSDNESKLGSYLKPKINYATLSFLNWILKDNPSDHNAEDEEAEGIVLQPRYPWEGSDRDYTYEEVCVWF